jgi:hypothetical protein
MASRPYIDIPLGPYEPDWGGLPRQEQAGYLVDATGAHLTTNGYRPLPTFADVASATQFAGVSDYGAHFRHVVGITQTSAFFAMTGSGAIYESRAAGTDTWQTVTPGGLGTFATPFANFFQFDDLVIMINAGMDPASKSLTDSHATTFAALGGSPPKARCGATVRAHAVLGGLITTDPYAVRWSAIGDAEDWPTPGTADARSKQAGTETLDKQYGVVRAVLGGEKFGIVVQEFALTRMTYVGGRAVYEFDTYHRETGFGFGRYSPFVTDGALWYWYNDKGFFATDGYSVASLSEGKIDDAIFNDFINHADADNVIASYSGAFDARRSLVIFSQAYGSSVTRHLCYHTRTKSFSFLSDSTIDAVFQGDATGTGPDSGRTAFAISSSRRLQKFSGASGSIALQTGYIELDPGYRVQLQGAHLLGTGTGSLTLAYKTAATSSDCDVSQSGFTSLTAAGLGQKKTGRASGQYIAFRITGTGAESQLINGIRVYAERAEPAP